MQQLGIDRDTAKNLPLRLIYGGTIDAWRKKFNVPQDAVLPDWCGRYDLAVRAASELIVDEYSERIMAIDTHEERGRRKRILSFALGGEETKIMQFAMQRAQEKYGVHIDVNVHDAFIGDPLPAGAIEEIERAIATELEYEVKFKSKPIERELTMHDYLGLYAQPLAPLEFDAKTSSHAQVAEHFMKHYQGMLLKDADDKLWCYCKDKQPDNYGLWTPGAPLLPWWRAIWPHDLPGNNIDYYKKMCETLKAMLPQTKLSWDKLPPHCMAWKNGVYNMLTEQFSDFRPEYMLRQKNALWYDPKENASAKVERCTLTLVTNLNEIFSYCEQTLEGVTVYTAYGLFWKGNLLKLCLDLVGKGGNAKTGFISIVCKAFPELCIHGDSSLFDKIDSSKPNPQVLTLAEARLAFIDEPGTINKDQFKKFISPYFKVCARNLHSNDMNTDQDMNASFLFTSNDPINLPNADEATLARLICVQMCSYFAPTEAAMLERLNKAYPEPAQDDPEREQKQEARLKASSERFFVQDPDFDARYNEEDMRRAVVLYFCAQYKKFVQEYKCKIPEFPEERVAELNECLQEAIECDPVEALFNLHFTITELPEDKLLIGDILDTLNRARHARQDLITLYKVTEMLKNKMESHNITKEKPRTSRRDGPRKKLTYYTGIAYNTVVRAPTFMG
jgi:hypothetical protein